MTLSAMNRRTRALERKANATGAMLHILEGAAGMDIDEALAGVGLEPGPSDLVIHLVDRPYRVVISGTAVLDARLISSQPLTD